MFKIPDVVMRVRPSGDINLYECADTLTVGHQWCCCPSLASHCVGPNKTYFHQKRILRLKYFIFFLTYIPYSVGSIGLVDTEQ